MKANMKALIGIFLVLTTGCAHWSGHDSNPQSQLAENLFADKAPYKPSPPPVVLVVGLGTAYENELLNSMNESIQDDMFFVSKLVLDFKSDVNVLLNHILSIRPTAIVLTHNHSLKLFREALVKSKYDLRTIPLFAAGISNLALNARNIELITGITLETPAIVAFANLSKSLNKPLNKVALIHRSERKEFVENQVTLFAQEGITLAPNLIEFSNQPHVVLRDSINAIIEDSEIDAIWVSNDFTALTSHSLIHEVWLPKLSQYEKFIVVEHPDLLNETPLGDFAVLPSPTSLGFQMSELVGNYFSIGQFEPGNFIMPLSLERILVLQNETRQPHVVDWQNFDRLIERK